MVMVEQLLFGLITPQCLTEISAQKGGSLSGNGGYAETSGGNVNIADATIDLLAPHGKTGAWLIDPGGRRGNLCKCYRFF